MVALGQLAGHQQEWECSFPGVLQPKRACFCQRPATSAHIQLDTCSHQASVSAKEGFGWALTCHGMTTAFFAISVCWYSTSGLQLLYQVSHVYTKTLHKGRDFTAWLLVTREESYLYSHYPTYSWSVIKDVTLPQLLHFFASVLLCQSVFLLCRWVFSHKTVR